MLPPSSALAQVLINARLVRQQGAPLRLLMTLCAMFVFADSDISMIRLGELKSLLDGSDNGSTDG